MNTSIVVIAHNIRSTHNVGSFFRTCDGFGVSHLYLTGYTPHPAIPQDPRLPHIVTKLVAQIHKTALGAEQTIPYNYIENPLQVITALKNDGYEIVALEQTPSATLLSEYTPTHRKIALLLGEEVHGIPIDILAATDHAIEIPMHGSKESFNVSVALGICLYGLLYSPKSA